MSSPIPPYKAPLNVGATIGTQPLSPEGQKYVDEIKGLREAFAASPAGQKINKLREQGVKIHIQFGISGNPIHKGHLDYVDRFAKGSQANQINIVPAKVNPQKAEDLAKAPYVLPQNEDKREIAKRAINAHNDEVAALEEKMHLPKELRSQKLDIDEVELNREGSSYTYLTTEEKYDASGKTVNCLLLTDESATNFYTWKNPHLIAQKTVLIYGGRPGEKPLDKELLINRLHAIEAQAKTWGLPEGVGKYDLDTWSKANNNGAALVEWLIKEKGAIPTGISVKIKDKDGIEKEETIPLKEFCRIHPSTIQSLDEGYVGISGTKEISSTTIRSAIQGGRTAEINNYLWPEVTQYIQDHRLYLPTEKKE